MNKTENEYRQWLIDLKMKIRQSQIKAAVKVNVELLRLYWDLGHDIVVRQMEANWGSRFFERLSTDLRKEFPDMKGFSSTNLKYSKRFYQFYTQDNTIRQQLTDELQVIDNNGDIIRQQLADELDNHPIFLIPWFHHVQIFTKCKTVHEALFYVQKTIDNSWSRAVLMNFLEADLYSSHGKSLNNFSRLLPEPQSDLANEKLSKLLPENYKSVLPSIEDIEKGLKDIL